STHSISLYSIRPPLNLHSFPTRRSSDLLKHEVEHIDAERRRRVVKRVVLDVRRVTQHRRHVLVRLLEPTFAEQHQRHARGSQVLDRKSTRLNSSHYPISYALFSFT